MRLEGKTIAEMASMRQAISDDPGNARTGSIYLYTPAAMKRMDKIDREITRRMAEQRAASGNPVVADGYSGRQTNRRR